MRLLFSLITLLVLPSITPAQVATAQECTVRVLLPITDDLQNRWRPGAILPVTIARTDDRGGSFCASGGSCLPRKSNGADSLELRNCRIGPPIGNGDFRLVANPDLAGKPAAHTMRTREEVNQELAQLGFSNASAGTLADEYVKTPHSPQARLVARALAGSAAAVTTLKRNNP